MCGQVPTPRDVVTQCTRITDTLEGTERNSLVSSFSRPEVVVGVRWKRRRNATRACMYMGRRSSNCIYNGARSNQVSVEHGFLSSGMLHESFG